MHQYLQDTVQLNINTMFEEALRTARVSMKDSEKKQFYDKHLKTLQMTIDEAGNVSFQFKHK